MDRRESIDPGGAARPRAAPEPSPPPPAYLSPALLGDGTRFGRQVAALLAELHRLAEQASWHEVATSTARLQVGEPALGIITAGQPAPAFLDWVRGLSTQGPLLVDTLERLVARRDTALAIDRIIVLVRFGYMFDAREVAALQRMLLGRPLESWAFVVVVPEGAAPADVERFERGLRRLMGLDGPRADPVGSRDAPGLLIWSPAGRQGRADDPLGARLDLDRAALGRWLADHRGRTPSEAPRLWLYRLSRLLDLAEARLLAEDPPAPAPAPAGPAADEGVRLRRARTALRDLHGRLLNRIQQDARLLQRQLEASHSTLEQDLRRLLQPRERGARDRQPPETAAGFAAIGERLNAWDAEVRALCAERRRDSARESRQLLAQVDWSTLAAACATPALATPDYVVHPLDADPDLPPRDWIPADALRSTGHASTGGGAARGVDLRVAVIAVVAALAVVAAAFAVGFGRPGAIVIAVRVLLGQVEQPTRPDWPTIAALALGLAVALAAVAALSRRRGGERRPAPPDLQGVLHELSRRARAFAGAAGWAALGAATEHVAHRIATLEAELDRAAGGAPAPAAPRAAPAVEAIARPGSDARAPMPATAPVPAAPPGSHPAPGTAPPSRLAAGGPGGLPAATRFGPQLSELRRQFEVLVGAAPPTTPVEMMQPLPPIPGSATADATSRAPGGTPDGRVHDGR